MQLLAGPGVDNRMKLPANVLAKLCLTGVVASAGCETAVEFERRSAPAPAKPVVQRVEVELDRPTYAKPPPGATRRIVPTPTPRPTIKPTIVPTPRASLKSCGPCGMG